MKTNEILANAPDQIRKPALMMIVRIKTELTKEEMLKIAREREPEFKAIPGILQKYYVKMGPSEYAGIYLWDSAESLAAFRESELAKTIPKAYKAVELPSVEVGEFLFQLRD